jgi:hypothetical protein
MCVLDALNFCLRIIVINGLRKTEDYDNFTANIYVKILMTNVG